MKDPYMILGVSRDASDDEIKKAYRTMSRKYHPDANINNPDREKAEEMFKTVQQAYNQIMKERESGYSSAYGQTYSQTRSGAGRATGYDGDYRDYREYRGGGFEDFGQFGGFWGFGPFGFGGYYQGGSSDPNMNGNDPVTIRLRAAMNYINNSSYTEAINTLESIEDRDGRWYYYSALAHAGKGEEATAIEHAKRALEKEPDNMQYQILYQRLSSGGNWYQSRRTSYGPASGAGFCMRYALMCLWCNCLCSGSSCCCPVSYYRPI